MPGSPLPSHNRTRLARRWRQRDVSTRPVHLVSHVHVQLAFHADTLHRVTQPWSCTNERVAWADGNSTATMFVEHGLSRVETADLVLRQTGHRRPRCTLWDRVIASQPRNRSRSAVIVETCCTSSPAHAAPVGRPDADRDLRLVHVQRRTALHALPHPWLSRIENNGCPRRAVLSLRPTPGCP